ncbi:hypothetical protein ACHHYP_02557 [Achlya hypogyna]|nr:hypothetical protein ACHHYP_02557 [Achlya hypogyna]
MNLKLWMLTAIAAGVAADSSSGSGSTTDAPPNAILSAQRPGYCSKTADCAKFGTGYSCVSVKSEVVGVSTLKQCVKGNVCSGNVAGACPTFTSWTPAKYRQIKPVCAFVAVPNCNQAMNAQGQVVQVRALRESAAKPAGNVTCFQVTFPGADESDSPIKVNGIYQCVDETYFVSKNLGQSLTSKQLKQCTGNTTASGGISKSLGLCNSHGTCAPTNAFSNDYQCICSTGYSPNDQCFNATGNTCDAFGQCGLGRCDVETGRCLCPPGTTGNQCSLCDPLQNNNASVTMCNGQGSCGLEGTCMCNATYTGSNCEIPVKVNKSAGGNTAGSTTQSAGYATQMSIALVSAATIIAAAML